MSTEKSLKKVDFKEILGKDEHIPSLVLDNINELVAFHETEDMKITWANSVAAVSVKKQLSEILGKECYLFWGDGKAICPGCPVATAFKTKKAGILERTSPDGRHWMIKGYPILEGEKFKGVIEIALDITNRKKTEDALTSRNKELETMNRASIDRELKMVELKKKIAQLEGKNK